jgi:hypothetical protein
MVVSRADRVDFDPRVRLELKGTGNVPGQNGRANFLERGSIELIERPVHGFL